MIDIPIRVKDALRDGTYLKNYRFIVLDDNGKEDFTIQNNNLVKESVKIDERLCSGDAIKFGLCEGSNLQFEYFDFPNIRGRRLKAILDIQYKDADNTLQWYPLPMGFYDVQECSLQFSTGIIKCSCYNKLKSDYLDADVKTQIIEIVSNGDGSAEGAAIISILDSLLEGYSISNKPDISLATYVYSGEKSYNEFIFTEHDTLGVTKGNGKYLHVYVISVNITSAEGYLKDEFYKIVTAVKKISSYVKKLRENVIAKYYSSGVLTEGFSSQCYIWEDFFQTQKSSADYVLYGAQLVIENALKEDIFKSLEFSEYEDESLNIEYVTNLEGKKAVRIHIPVMYKLNNSSSRNLSSSEMDNAFEQMISAIPEMVEVYKRNLTDVEKYRITEEKINNLQDVTLRQLQSAVFELSARYGQLDRETDLFSGIELNNARLLPSETLYPQNQLYPTSNAIYANRSLYNQLWTDNGGAKKFRYLIVTYKTLDEENKEATAVLQRTINTDGNEDYDMSDNWLFNNFVWTAEQVGAYADAMVEKMKNLTWFPFEMWCAGLPFIETGDEIEIPTKDSVFASYVLQRQLNGIQNLQDTYMNGMLNVF